METSPEKPSLLKLEIIYLRAHSCQESSLHSASVQQGDHTHTHTRHITTCLTLHIIFMSTARSATNVQNYKNVFCIRNVCWCFLSVLYVTCWQMLVHLLSIKSDQSTPPESRWSRLADLEPCSSRQVSGQLTYKESFSSFSYIHHAQVSPACDCPHDQYAAGNFFACSKCMLVCRGLIVYLCWSSAALPLAFVTFWSFCVGSINFILSYLL